MRKSQSGQSGYVELDSGERLSLAELRQAVPYSCFWSDIHLEVCHRLASHRDLASHLRAVYINLLFTKSDRAKQLTAMIELVRLRKLRVRAVVSDFIEPDFADLLGNEVEIQLRTPTAPNLVDFRWCRRYCLKTLVHRLFRLFRRRNIRAKNVVRAWVDTTDSAYPIKAKTATLLIHPFSASLARQRRYVRRCRREGRDFSLMGLPYRISDIFRIAIKPSKRDMVLVEGEMHAFREGARELLAMGVEHVDTTDDFLVAACEMYRELMEHGVTCVNTSHGIGVYCPYVCYSHFSFYNDQQKLFYQRKGRFETHGFREIIPPEAVIRAEPGSDYEPVIVYLDGPWRQVGKLYEARLGDQAIERIKTACGALGLPFAIKVHPNVSDGEVARVRTDHGVTVAREMSELPGRHPVFMILLSTAYYAFLLDGPIVFIEDDLLRPKEVFGDGAYCVRLEDLEKRLAPFREGSHWASRYRAQIEYERNRASQSDGADTEITH